jgi:type II secretory pathway component PulF
MALMITPGQLARRADFYHQLSQLHGAGIDILRALQQLQAHPPSPVYRHKLRHLLDELAHGFTFTESAQRVGNWLPPFDLALLQAGEHSGKLEACFKVLADYYTDRARLARQVIADLAYPVFLLHFGVLIFAFVKFFQSSNWLGLAIQVMSVLLPIYIVVGVMIFASQSSHGERWRSFIERLLAPIPVLGTGRSYLSLARLSAALEALLSAGVTIIEAWELAATASGSPALRRTVTAWRPLVDAGQTPAEVVRSSHRFPEMFASQYASGEISGKLDDTLKRMHLYYQEEGTRKLHIVAQWVPRAIYLAVAVYIAVFVIKFYTGYLKQIEHPGGF